MLKTGTILAGRYEIVGRIGAGGMADVYKAMDSKLNRYVAVKVMKPEFANDSSFISKFRSEAQAAAGLANPNIVNVYDVGEDQGNYYIVMELVEGITLKEYIAKKGKLSVREATSIAIQVCMGLAAAHDQGIVHRDVKPQNICISTDGKVKVTDFGIARAASSNTISANAMGSVHYSSPEQVRGGYSDARSDIYSLGITLYEMVTGRVPFDGETTVAIAIKHLQDEMEPPTKYTPDLPYALEQIIYKCTQKSVDRRYQSMNEVIADLKRSLMEPDGHFVQLAPLTDQGRTVMISDKDREAIREGRLPEGKKQPEQTKSFSSIENARKGVEPEREPEEEKERDNKDEEEGSSGLEKAVTVGSFIVCGLIICILIFFICRAAGLFRTGQPSDSESGAASVTSAAAGTVNVPNIIGMTEADAKTTAASKNLTIQSLGQQSSDQAAGTVVYQSPDAGTAVEANSAISYYVSSGPETIAVPAVTGQYVTDAGKALKQAGFESVSVTKQNSSDVTVGNVISVSPAEGEQVTAKTEITLTVSSGPEGSEDITATSYIGYGEDEAVAAAKAAGFIVTVAYGSSENVDADQVMSQSVNAGDTVAYGSDLTLTVNNPQKAAAESAAESVAETAGGDAASGAARSGASNASSSGKWTATASLLAPTTYQNGAYRLVLVQNVNGTDQQTVIEENTTALTFPYTLRVTGADGVTDGTVYLYEQENGNYVARAEWPVTFKENS